MRSQGLFDKISKFGGDEEPGVERAGSFDEVAEEFINAAVELAERAQQEVRDAKDFIKDLQAATERLGIPQTLKALAGVGLDGVQAALGVAGLFPVLGEIADLADLLISVARGDKVGVALGIASLVPWGGQAAGLAKTAYRAEKIGSGLSAATRLGEASSSLTTATKARGNLGTPSTNGGFLVHPNGTAVHRSQAEMVESITNAGATKIGPTVKGDGIIFKMDSPGGPMEVRVMDGTPGGDANSGPRTVTTRIGTLNAKGKGGDRVQPNGDDFPNGTPKNDRQVGGHTHGQVNDR